MTAFAAGPIRPPQGQHSAFRNLVAVETKLMIREIVPLLWGLVFPMVLLTILGEFSDGPDKSLDGLSLVASYVPILIAFTCSTFALQGLPAVLAGYRERGILRRYKLAPIHPLLLISSRLVANFLIALSTLLMQIGVAIVVYRMPIAGSFMAMTVMLSTGALAFLALGLLIASVAESVKVALALANLLFFPLMFLGGAAIPKFMLPPAIQKISRLTPSNYMVEGLGRIMVDGKSLSDSGTQLIVLAMTFVTALFVAAKFFRWEK